MADLTSVPSQFDFAMPSGDSRTLRVKCVGTNGQPFSLAEAVQVRWQLARSVRGPGMITKTLGGGVEIVQDGDNWYIDVELMPEDTASYAGEYYHECEVRFSDGAVLTPYAGTASISQDLNT